MHLIQDPILSQALKLLLALGFGILLTPFLLLALFCLFLALILLFPAFCVFSFALLLTKISFKGAKGTTDQQGLQEEQVSIELDSSEFSFGSYDSEDNRNWISETGRLNKHFELWRNWDPDSVETPPRKPFHELLSFWRRLEKPEVKQRDHQIRKQKP